MYKTLAIAALAGAVSAQWTQTLVPTVNIVDSNGFSYYNFDVKITADAGYQTLYNPKKVGPAWNEPEGNSETYTFNIFATAVLTFRHELAESYKGVYDFTFDVLDVTPFGQTVNWNRPEGGSFQVMGHGFREVIVGNAHTMVSELAKTCQWSVYNDAMNGNMQPTCAYDEKKWTKYEDPYWQFNAGGHLMSALGMTSYYGAAEWFHF